MGSGSSPLSLSKRSPNRLECNSLCLVPPHDLLGGLAERFGGSWRSGVGRCVHAGRRVQSRGCGGSSPSTRVRVGNRAVPAWDDIPRSAWPGLPLPVARSETASGSAWTALKCTFSRCPGRLSAVCSPHIRLPVTRRKRKVPMPTALKNSDRLRTRGWSFRMSDGIVEPHRPVFNTNTGGMDAGDTAGFIAPPRLPSGGHGGRSAWCR